MKECITCKETKELTEFTICRRYSDGLNRYCKDCPNSYTKTWRTQNVDRQKKTFRRAKLKQYGLTDSDFQTLLKLQDNKCAICDGPPMGRWKVLYVDHCHHTKKVRGLLCQLCNVALGGFKDDPILLDKAANYLRTSVYETKERN